MGWTESFYASLQPARSNNVQVWPFLGNRFSWSKFRGKTSIKIWASLRRDMAKATNVGFGPEAAVSPFSVKVRIVRSPDVAHDPANVCEPQEAVVAFTGGL